MNDDTQPATIEVQWPDSDVCLHLNCVCGHDAHFDIPSIVMVTCPNCGADYQLPTEIELAAKK